MGFSRLTLILVLVSLPAIWAHEIRPATISVDGIRAIAETDDHFVCATMDWFPSDTCRFNDCMMGNTSAINLVGMQRNFFPHFLSPFIIFVCLTWFIFVQVSAIHFKRIGMGSSCSIPTYLWKIKAIHFKTQYGSYYDQNDSCFGDQEHERILIPCETCFINLLESSMWFGFSRTCLILYSPRQSEVCCVCFSLLLHNFRSFSWNSTII